MKAIFTLSRTAPQSRRVGPAGIEGVQSWDGRQNARHNLEEDNECLPAELFGVALDDSLIVFMVNRRW